MSKLDLCFDGPLACLFAPDGSIYFNFARWYVIRDQSNCVAESLDAEIVDGKVVRFNLPEVDEDLGNLVMSGSVLYSRVTSTKGLRLRDLVYENMDASVDTFIMPKDTLFKYIQGKMCLILGNRLYDHRFQYLGPVNRSAGIQIVGLCSSLV